MGERKTKPEHAQAPSPKNPQRLPWRVPMVPCVEIGNTPVVKASQMRLLRAHGRVDVRR